MLQDLKFSVRADNKTGPAMKGVSNYLQGVETQLTRINTAAAKSATINNYGRSLVYSGSATARLGKSAGGAAGSMRMLTQQLSQVGQQAMAGGDFVRALAIQLPDMGLAFGAAGTAIGLVAGIALPFLMEALSGSEGEANDLENALKSVEGIVSRLNDPLDVLSMSAGDLAEKYGEAADKVRAYAKVQAEIATAEATAGIEALTLAVGDSIRMFETSATGGRELRNTLLRITDQFGLAGAEARKFEGLLSDWRNADGARAQEDAFANVLQYMRQMNITASDLPPEMRSVVSEMIKLMRNSEEARAVMDALSDAASGVAPALKPSVAVASSLADQLGRAFSAAQALANQQVNDLLVQKIKLDTVGQPIDQAGALAGAQFDARVPSGIDIGLQNAMGIRGQRSQYINNARQLAVMSAAEKAALAALRDTDGNRGSSGGAGDEADKLTRSLDTLLGQLDPVYKGMQQYREATDLLTQSLNAGKITQDEFNTYLQKAQDQFLKSGEELKNYTQEVGDFLGDFGVLVMENVDNLDDLKAAVNDFVRSAMRDLLKLAISKGFQALMSLAFGGTGGSLIGGLFGGVAAGGGGGLLSFAGGGHTGAGPRSGGVDGFGGFPAILHPNETVVDHTKSGGATVQIHIGAEVPRGTVQHDQDRIDIQLGPLIAQFIESGALDRANRNRYGLVPRGRGA